MNHKFKQISKRTLCALLSVMILISAMTVGSIGNITASADTTYYLAGDTQIRLYDNAAISCAWQRGNTNFTFSGSNTADYTVNVYLPGNAEFKVTDSTNWFGYTDNNNDTWNIHVGPDSGLTYGNDNNLKLISNQAGYYAIHLNLAEDKKWAWVSSLPAPTAPDYYIGGRFVSKSADGETTYHTWDTTGYYWNETRADSNFKLSRVAGTGYYRFETNCSPAELAAYQDSLPQYFWIMSSKDQNSVDYYYQPRTYETNSIALNGQEPSGEYKVTPEKIRYDDKWFYFDNASAGQITTGKVDIYFDPSDVDDIKVWYVVKGSAQYTVTCAQTANGTISAAETAFDGDDVTVTAAPDDDLNSTIKYKCSGVRVYKTSDYTDVTDDVSLRHTGINTYVFTMPEYDVTVAGEFSVTQYYTATPSTNGYGKAEVKVDKGDFGTNTKSFKGFCDSVTFKATNAGDYVFDHWEVTSNDAYYKIEDGMFVYGDANVYSSEFTVYPTASITAVAVFVEDPGTNDGTKHIIYRTDDNFDNASNPNNAAQIVYRAANGNSNAIGENIYYADIDLDIGKSAASQLWFATSGTASKDDIWWHQDHPDSDYTKQMSCDVPADSGISADTQFKNTYNSIFLNGLSQVKRIRIYLTNNNGSVDYTHYNIEILEMRSGGIHTTTTVTLYTKQGTVRNGDEKRNDGTYSIYPAQSTTASAESGVSGGTNVFYDHAKMYTVQKGTTVTLTTTVKPEYRNKMYVKAFCINGESYGIIDEPKPGDANRTSGTYTTEYTIPEETDTAYFEVTPIYFYFTDSASDNKGNEYITFYAEDFVGDVKTQWGDTLSCYAWYTQNDKADTTDGKRPALGGYPGQPMVYENGSYYTQIPKYWWHTGDTARHTVQGVTLNNYYWDDVHFFYGNRGASDENCQTYDYDDFAAIMEYENVDDIVFTFKYRTVTDNGGNFDVVGGGSLISDKNKTFFYDTAADKNGNDVNPLVDYYDYSIDIFGNRIKENNEYLKESDIYEKIAANRTVIENEPGNTSPSFGDGNEFIYVISDGYSSCDNEFIGYYATKWHIYDQSGKHVGALPPSALVFDPTAVYGSEDIPAGAPVPDAFLGYSDKAKTFTNREAYWEVYKELYNAYRNVPAVITFEKAIAADGELDDLGLRCDGRWYFSRRGEYVNAAVKIQIVDKDGNIIEDDFVDPNDDSSITGSLTNARAYFTNPEFNMKTKSGDVLQNENAFFEFKADGVSTGTDYEDKTKTCEYEFIGWYFTIGVNNEYSNINVGDDIASTTGKRAMVSNATFVARYAKIEQDDINTKTLIVTHNPLSDATEGSKPSVHNGTGSTEVSSVVITYSDGTTKTIRNTTTSLVVTPEDLKNASSVSVTLKTIPSDSNARVYDVYNMDENSVYTKSGENTANTWETVYGKTCGETEALTLPANDSEPVLMTYTYSFTDLFKNDDSAETKHLDFFGDFTSAVITVNVKYYDRKIVNNMPTTISEEPTIATFRADISGDKTLAEAITRDVMAELDNSIGNVIDDYKIWPSQNLAVEGIRSLPNLKVEPVEAGTEGADPYDNNAGGTWHYTYGACAQPDNPNYDTYKAADFQKHTDCYGTPYGVDGYIGNGEDWVTYYDASGKAIDGSDTANVASVTIWAFNTPKLYTITPVGPAANGTLTNKTTLNGKDVYYITADGDNKFAAMQQRGFYNQRLGVATGDDSVVDASVEYLTKYAGISGFLGTNIKAEQNITGSVFDGEENTAFVFDGWYAADSEGNILYKITDNVIYGYRITTDLTIVAGYRPAEIDSSIGLSLTNNGIDFLEVNGVKKVRFNTQFNIYGIEDDNTVGDNTHFIDKLAMVYIQLPAVYTANNGEVKKFSGETEDEKELIAAVAARVKEDIAAGGDMFDKIGLSTAYIDITSLNVEFDNGTAMGDPKYVEYTYEVVESDGGAYKTVLTNKNRVQYVLGVNASDYAPGGRYSAVIAFGGMYVDDSESGHKWIASDNYVSYINPDNSADDTTNKTI